MLLLIVSLTQSKDVNSKNFVQKNKNKKNCPRGKSQKNKKKKPSAIKNFEH